MEGLAAVKRAEVEGPTYVTYEYDEHEFKDKLGIEEDEPIITVERHIRTGSFIVRLRKE